MALPPLNALRAFDAAGRHLNFRLAAEELGVTQAAVAQQVRGLEARLAAPLFERLPKGLAFTATGRAYHGKVAAAFADLRAATAALQPQPSTVLISVTPTFAAKWLIPNLPALAADLPDVDLKILATETLARFEADSIDLAVRHARPPFGAALEAVRLFRHEVIAVATPDLLRGAEGASDAERLAVLPKLHDAHDLWPQFLAELGVSDRSGRGVRLNQTALAIDAAREGQGVALVSRFLVAGALLAGHLTKVSDVVLAGGADFYLIAPRSPRRKPAASRTFEWLVARART